MLKKDLFSNKRGKEKLGFLFRTRNENMLRIFLLLFLVFICLPAGAVFASQGTIDSVYKYAWSNQIGWVNFGNSYGNVVINDTTITGYAWNDNYGWINMAPTFGGVTNTTLGNVGGYAWGENVGWINFDSVAIGCSGQFSGTATGDTIGTLSFDCTNCKVITNWQRASCSGGGGSHTVCSNQQCISIDGGGTNQCTTNNDCLPVAPTHTECNTQLQCVSVAGGGANQCSNNGECVAPIHNECNAQLQCVSVSGGGANQCSNNGECVAPTHNECNAQLQCVSVSGGGANQCSSNGECTPTPTHSECNDQKKCVLANGAGNNLCQSNNDCDGPTPIIIVPPPDKIIEIIGSIMPPIIPRNIIKAVQTPIGSMISRVASTTGVVITTTAITTGIMAYPDSLLEIFLILRRLFSFLLLAFGIKRGAKPWGVVYDSVTKQPVDPAYVTLKDIQTRKTYSAITDIDGRYGFLAEPGKYVIVANKTNYAFPSQKLAGKINDELYDSLYFGAQIEIKKQGEVIINNIPLDPIKFDWNEFAKKDKGLMKFYSRWDLVLRKISNLFFVIGFVVAIVAFFVAPYPYNTVVLGLYLFLLLLRVLGIKPKSLGYVTDKTTDAPLSFAIIRIMLPDSNIEISHKITDKYGRYYCLIPKGKYYLKIETKNSDETYSLVHTSGIIDASKTGIIKTSFKI